MSVSSPQSKAKMPHILGYEKYTSQDYLEYRDMVHEKLSLMGVLGRRGASLSYFYEQQGYSREEDDDSSTRNAKTDAASTKFWSESNDSGYEVYMFPQYPPESVLLFETEEDWKPELFREGIWRVEFGPKFVVEDSHLTSMARAPPFFHAGLRSILCHNDTGYTEIIDAILTDLILACPNLEDVLFERAVNLTDAAVAAIVYHCPNIKSITVTGIKEEADGSMEGYVLRDLQDDPDIAKDLVFLNISEQLFEEDEPAQALSERRPNLTLHVSFMGDGEVWKAGEMIHSYLADDSDDEDEDGDMDECGYESHALFGPNGPYDYDEQFRGTSGFDSDD